MNEMQTVLRTITNKPIQTAYFNNNSLQQSWGMPIDSTIWSHPICFCCCNLRKLTKNTCILYMFHGNGTKVHTFCLEKQKACQGFGVLKPSAQPHSAAIIIIAVVLPVWPAFCVVSFLASSCDLDLAVAQLASHQALMSPMAVLH